MKTKTIVTMIAVFTAVFLLTRCTKDDSGLGERGMLTLLFTDAPSDDENIKGIFITVAGIKINGKIVRNFAPKTIEVSDLRDGKTEVLLKKELASKKYRQVTFLLDEEKDDTGETPGNYVLTKDNIKHNLFEGTKTRGEIDILKEFEVSTGLETKLVIDFDLRKAVVYNEPNSKSLYRIVTDNELQNAVRMVVDEKSGTITGLVNKRGRTTGNLFVLLYRKGEFDEITESSGFSESKVLFPRSVSSTMVEHDGSYKFWFVEEGEYEVKVASFTKMDGSLIFREFLRTTSKKTGTLLNSIMVPAGSEVQINIEVFNLL
jgi:hypothetical protein